MKITATYFRGSSFDSEGLCEIPDATAPADVARVFLSMNPSPGKKSVWSGAILLSGGLTPVLIPPCNPTHRARWIKRGMRVDPGIDGPKPGVEARIRAIKIT
jgi:hypothetical protein